MPEPLESTIAVVGAGLAGLRVCERLRAAGHTGRIVVVGEEEHAPYNRPPLSKEVLRGTMDRDKLPFRQKAHDRGRRVAARHPRRVRRRRRRTRSTLSDGSELAWDGLVYATGVRARRLDLDGAELAAHDPHPRRRAPARARRCTPGTRVVVIGAGFIGCEVAATAVERGCDVTVVEPLGTPLERAVGTVVGREVQRRHELHNVRFALGRTVRGVTDAGEHLEVELDNGAGLAADVIVEAVGSAANTEPLEGQGLDLANGVLCDGGLHPLRDGEPVLDVVVVGDVARFPIRAYGDQPVRVEHWTMPTDMAAHAAAEPAGRAGRRGRARPASRRCRRSGASSTACGCRPSGCRTSAPSDVRVLDGDLAGEAAVGFHRDGRAGRAWCCFGMGKRMLEFRTAVVDAVSAEPRARSVTQPPIPVPGTGASTRRPSGTACPPGSSSS